MIKVQHEHEQQWWEGRKALIERQKARKEGQKKLDDVLYVYFLRLPNS
jgi:L-rhamnose mutarotase